MTSSARFTVNIIVGEAESHVSGVVTTDKEWKDLTEAQIKEKVGEAYRNALGAVLKARRAVTPS